MPRRIAGPCPSPGCPNRAGQCPAHKLAPRQARGYDAEHDRLRAQYQRRMDAGETFTCWRCLEERGITHDVDPRAWDLGHHKGRHRGPECPAGNRAAPHRRGG